MAPYLKYKSAVTPLVIILCIAMAWLVFPTPQEDHGKAAIGGAFTLIDRNGNPTTQDALKDKISVVFFGFTHCPDVCPTSAATISQAMELLEDKANGVLPVFISVDPERDTPEALRDYFANFDKRFLALTGTPEQVKVTANAYKVFFSPVKMNSSGKDYMVNHSGYIYLMDRDGEYIKHFPYNVSTQTLADAIREQL